MGLEEIIPAIFLIAVLVLILPEFLKSNSKIKDFLKNLSIWIVIILATIIILYFIF